jgi:lysophospholipase L1-like esterase
MTHSLIHKSGRILFTDRGALLSWSGSSLTFHTESPLIIIHFEDHANDVHHTYFTVLVDNEEYAVFSPTLCPDRKFALEFGTSRQRQISIVKRTEPLTGHTLFTVLESGTPFLPLSPSFLGRKKIEFIGDSLTCGYGCEEPDPDKNFRAQTENFLGSFAAVTAKNLDAEYHVVAWSGRGVIRNWDDAQVRVMPDLFKYTIPESGEKWDFSRWQPDIVVINLGSNDYGQGPVDEEDFIQSLVDLLKILRDNYGKVPVIFPLGCALSNDGQTNQFTGEIYPALDLYTQVMNQMAEKARKEMLDPLFLFPFTKQEREKRGMGADKHPSIEQNILNGGELARFIRLKGLENYPL